MLLELLDSAWQEWLAALEADLGGAIDATAPPAGRGDQLAAALAGRPVLCDLLSATLREVLEVLVAGLLARSSRP